MLRKLRERTQEERGFTLIELLVVILIIGILAAIAIPSFLNQRSKGQDAEAKSAVKTAQTAMETYFTDNQTYAVSGASDLINIEATLVDATNLQAAGTATTYTVSVDSVASGDTEYSISRAADGSVTRACDQSGAGGCSSTGDW